MKELKIVLATPGPDTALALAELCDELKDAEDVVISLAIPQISDTFNSFLDGSLISLIDGMIVNCKGRLNEKCDIISSGLYCDRSMKQAEYEEIAESYRFAKQIAVTEFANRIYNDYSGLLFEGYDKYSIYVPTFKEYENDLDIMYKAIVNSKYVAKDDFKICGNKCVSNTITDILNKYPGLLEHAVGEDYFAEYSSDVLLGISDAISAAETDKEEYRIIKEVYENNLTESDVFRDISFVVEHILDYHVKQLG